MSVKKGAISSKLRHELEKGFFFTTFKEITNHPSLINLDLTEEEILYNRENIKIVIQSYNSCGDSKKFCSSLDEHYSLKRNQDGQLILVSCSCEKQKRFLSIPEEILNKKIASSIKNQTYQFTYEEAKEVIGHLSQTYKEFELVGSKEFFNGNRYCYLKDKIFIPYLLNAILTETKFKIVTSQELLNHSKSFLFYKQENLENSNNFIDSLINVPCLAIFDLGLESGFGKGEYYLDFLPMFFQRRNQKNKYTYIFSNAVWGTIMKNLRGHNYYIKNEKLIEDDIRHIKADRLDAIVKEMFSQGS